MPGTHAQDESRVTTLVEPRVRKRYIVVRREDVWFIIFGGEEFGPYKTDREAKLFAIDAAHKLGEQGEQTEVMVSSDEAGAVLPVWVYGQPYPPRE